MELGQRSRAAYQDVVDGIEELFKRLDPEAFRVRLLGRYRPQHGEDHEKSVETEKGKGTCQTEEEEECSGLWLGSCPLSG